MYIPDKFTFSVKLNQQFVSTPNFVKYNLLIA